MSAKTEMDGPSNWSNKGVLEHISQSDTTCYPGKCNACWISMNSGRDVILNCYNYSQNGKWKIWEE